MKSYKLLIHEEAEADLSETFDHIANDSPEAAEKWRSGLLKKATSLRRFPLRCPLAPETELLGHEVRHLIHGDYRIIFAVQGNAVTVLQVRHGARRPGEITERAAE